MRAGHLEWEWARAGPDLEALGWDPGQAWDLADRAWDAAGVEWDLLDLGWWDLDLGWVRVALEWDSDHPAWDLADRARDPGDRGRACSLNEPAQVQPWAQGRRCLRVAPWDQAEGSVLACRG